MGISREQALDCFRSNDLIGIGMEADAVRRRLHPEGVVGYALGCEVALGGVSLDAICGTIAESAAWGGSGVRLGFGGASGDEIEEVVRGVRQRFPEVWIEGLAVADVSAVALGWGLGLRETLARLMDAGLDGIAGDGVDLRGSFAQWIEVQRAAHGVGMRTTAAMVFGAGETLEQRVNFLTAVRDLQAETGGFAAFVAVAADAPNGRELDGVTAVERLKTLAIARMFLDGIENMQASAGQGLKVLQTALRFGANDVGWVTPGGSNEEDVRRVIRDAGFKTAQRDAAYRAMMLS